MRPSWRNRRKSIVATWRMHWSDLKRNNKGWYIAASYDLLLISVYWFLWLFVFRSASIQHVNNMLRDQLEQATSANQQLTMDIQKLTADWNKAREELETRDEEEQAYFANEHTRLMDLWKSLNGFRRQFNEMKSSTQRCLLKIFSKQFLSYMLLFLHLLLCSCHCFSFLFSP